MTPTADDAEAAYRTRNSELIEKLEAAGHEPVIRILMLPTPVGALERTLMYCRRCGREADRVVFNRLSPSKPCSATQEQPPPT